MFCFIVMFGSLNFWLTWALIHKKLNEAQLSLSLAPLTALFILAGWLEAKKFNKLFFFFIKNRFQHSAKSKRFWFICDWWWSARQIRYKAIITASGWTKRRRQWWWMKRGIWHCVVEQRETRSKNICRCWAPRYSA